MIAIGHIEHGIAQNDHRFFVGDLESPGQGIVLSFLDFELPDPLPELSLSGPELSFIPAYYPGGFFSFPFVLISCLMLFYRHNFR